MLEWKIHYIQKLQKPDICLPGAEDSEETPDFEFNLEDTILAAATAQGIEIPDEPIVKEEPVQEVNTAEDAEDYMSEEDLRSAEEEFLNGPVKKQDPEEEIYDDLEELSDELKMTLMKISVRKTATKMRISVILRKNSLQISMRIL